MVRERESWIGSSIFYCRRLPYHSLWFVIKKLIKFWIFFLSWVAHNAHFACISKCTCPTQWRPHFDFFVAQTFPFVAITAFCGCVFHDFVFFVSGRSPPKKNVKSWKTQPQNSVIATNGDVFATKKINLTAVFHQIHQIGAA